MPRNGESEEPGLSGTPRPGERATRAAAGAGFRIDRLARSFCVLGASIGALGLVDDLTKARLWVAFLPHEPSTTRSAALGLFFVGGAAALRCPPKTGRPLCTLSLLGAIAALAIGVLSLFGYAFATDPDLDLLSMLGTQAGTRPAPVAAAAITLLALAVLLLDVRPRTHAAPSDWLALCAWVAAFTAFLGYVFGAAVLYRLTRAPLIGVEPPAALSLMLTATGLLFARPASGFMRVATGPGMGGALMRRLTLVAIVTPALVGVGTLHHILSATRTETTFAPYPASPASGWPSGTEMPTARSW